MEQFPSFLENEHFLDWNEMFSKKFQHNVFKQIIFMILVEKQIPLEV